MDEQRKKSFKINVAIGSIILIVATIATVILVNYFNRDYEKVKTFFDYFAPITLGTYTVAMYMARIINFLHENTNIQIKQILYNETEFIFKWLIFLFLVFGWMFLLITHLTGLM